MNSYLELNGYENYNLGTNLSNFYFIQNNINDTILQWTIQQDLQPKNYQIFIWT